MISIFKLSELCEERRSGPRAGTTQTRIRDNDVEGMTKVSRMTRAHFAPHAIPKWGTHFTARKKVYSDLLRSKGVRIKSTRSVQKSAY
jgi:glycerol-3-phosphate O-acyltransferase